MTQATRSNPLGWPAWAWVCLVALMICFTAWSVDGSIANLARAGGWLRDIGAPGITTIHSPRTGIGWAEVTQVAPNSPAARIGLKRGDLVRSDSFAGINSLGRTAWPHPLTVKRDARDFTVEMVTTPVDRFDEAAAGLVAAAVGALAATALAWLVIYRAGRRRQAMLLGALLLGYASSAVALPPWAPSPLIAQIFVVLAMLGTAYNSALKLLFALEISGGAADRRKKRVVYLAATTIAATYLLRSFSQTFWFYVPGLEQLLVPLFFVNNMLVFGLIALNYRTNDASTRNRIKIVATALFLYFVAALIEVGAKGVYGNDQVVYLIGNSAVELVAIALLAYAVLRQRLFDFGFAVNRTLVFGAISFVMLACFGLAEWGADRVLPESWHQRGEVVSAAVALALFLSFHRLRDWIERHVERLFFGSWQRAEAALRRFVDSAGHFEQVPALCRDFVGELVRFSGGAPAALYLRRDGGGFVLQAGKLPGAKTRHDDDGRGFAVMRAERRPLDLVHSDHPLPGTLALPMLDQGNLIGFVLLGEKPEGAHYRPDEVENLGWAAHQVGLDLRALQARQLEAENARLRDRLAIFEHVPARPAVA